MVRSLRRTLINRPYTRRQEPALDRLLIVDPDPRFRDRIQGFLQKEFSIDYARSLEEAEQMVSTTRYHSASTEISLPRGPFDPVHFPSPDTIENAHQFISICRRDALYVVVLTEHPTMADKSNAFHVYNKYLVTVSGLLFDYIRALHEHTKAVDK